METNINKLIKEFVEYQKASRQSPTTIKCVAPVVKKFFNVLGWSTLKKSICKKDVDVYIHKIQAEGQPNGKPYSASTINKNLRYLKIFFEYLVEMDIISTSPINTRKQKLKEEIKTNEARLEKNLTEDEFNRLTDAMVNDTQLYTIINVTAFLGLRIGDIVNLKIQDVKNNGLKIVHGKGGKTRIAYTDPVIIELITDYIENHRKNPIIMTEDEYNTKFIEHRNVFGNYENYLFKMEQAKENVFLSTYGHALSQSSLRYKMKQLGKQVGIDESKLFPHNLRKYFATMFYNEALKNGENSENVLEKLRFSLGHSDINTTRGYIGISVETMVEASKVVTNKFVNRLK